MRKLFTFEQLDQSKKPVRINAIFIDFAGGHVHRYNPPTWEGEFELPLDDDFFIEGICDGGGCVEVEYEDGTRENILPINVEKHRKEWKENIIKRTNK